ncbi:MAG: hypothetical protein K2I79_01750, partial [Clostridia bacterium]|nr:hypothetical protein [Clostridia bacterium]
MREDLFVYDTLCRIYRDGSWCAKALNEIRQDSRAFVTNAVYGIVSNDVKFNYIISQLIPKKPKNQVLILLKMGLYYIDYMSAMPDYAAVNRVIDCAEHIGKGAVKGLINAVLKRYIREGVNMPEDKARCLSVQTSTPLWLVEKYIQQYGYDIAKSFLSVPKFTKQHIRANKNKISNYELYAILDNMQVEYEKDERGCFVNWSTKLADCFNKGDITVQSLTSMFCCESAGVKDGMSVLDMCSAPGGKAVYLSELADISVTCCDIKAHRLQLIESYISRMGAKKLICVFQDAQIYNSKLGNFDVVLCDVPCSGFGVVESKPDIYLHREEKDIGEIVKIQKNILYNAAKYVVQG